MSEDVRERLQRSIEFSERTGTGKLAAVDLREALTEIDRLREKVEELGNEDWFRRAAGQHDVAFYVGYSDALREREAAQPFASSKLNYSYQRGYDVGRQDVLTRDRLQAKLERVRQEYYRKGFNDALARGEVDG